MLVEFRDSVDENRDVAAAEIAHLDNAPHDMDTVNAVFRSLHNIKGNARMCMLDRMSVFAHHIEEIFSEIRQGRLEYIHELGEVTLLALDELRHFCMKMSEGHELDENVVAQFETDLDAIRTSPTDAAQVQARARRAIGRFTGKLSPDADIPVVPPVSVIVSAHHDHPALEFFRDLALRLDARFSYWNGRTERTLPLLLKLNSAAPRPVDARQLEAALYLHDIGNAFLPESLLMKDDKYTETEWNVIKQHPAIGASLLRQMAGWEAAATMVEQHHQWADGSHGYPNLVPPEKLHEGAKMLAIVDSYESMTHPRADRQYRRSILRAVTEINNCAGRQFSTELVPVFNTIVRELVTSHS